VGSSESEVSVRPSPFWKNKLSFPADPFVVAGGGDQPRWVKFTVFVSDLFSIAGGRQQRGQDSSSVYGYSLAFGPSHYGLIDSFSYVGLNGLETAAHGSVPSLAFVAFQMMFAVITPALISGAFAERMKFSAYVAFVVVWSTLVYVPVAHWVWAEEGWLFKLGALDFAGGTVVHLTAGASALVCALMVGKRLKYPQERPLPHNLSMTLTGAGILWFGWFGFNAGSALTSGWLASLAFMNTHLGAAGAALGGWSWSGDRLRSGTTWWPAHVCDRA